MENSTVLIEQLRNFIAEATFTNREKIKEDTLLFKEDIFDSLGFLSVINFIDEELGIKVSDDELMVENFESINAILEFVSRKKSLQ